MNVLTFKLPPDLGHALQDASERLQTSRSELVRRAVSAYLAHGADTRGVAAAPSALDLAGDLAGCFGGGPADLSSDPRHLDGFGTR